MKPKKRIRISKFYRNLYFFTCCLAIAILFLCTLLSFAKIAQVTLNSNSRSIQIEASKNEEDYPNEKSIRLIMVGDALIHSAVYADAKVENGYDFSPMFEQVKGMFEGYDLAFYNQESILGGQEIGLSTYPRFNSPNEVGDAFREMGFNLVSLANNHTLDRGEAAILRSKNYWNSYPDVITAGSYSSWEEREEIPIGEKNGITYALLAYTDTTNGLSAPKGKEYLVNRYSEEQVKKDVEKIRDKVDVLLVSMHFGVEYTHHPTARQQEIAHYLASLGVDIVIGHHPHVIQPVEFIDDTMVIYSLGNFISAQREISQLTGLVASVTIQKTTTKDTSTVTLEDPTVELVYTDSTRVNGVRKNFRLYRYSQLTDTILPNYKEYQEKYLSIAAKDDRIEKR